jgi:hypothetical protein
MVITLSVIGQCSCGKDPKETPKSDPQVAFSKGRPLEFPPIAELERIQVRKWNSVDPLREVPLVIGQPLVKALAVNFKFEVAPGVTCVRVLPPESEFHLRWSDGTHFVLGVSGDGSSLQNCARSHDASEFEPITGIFVVEDPNSKNLVNRSLDAAR